MLTLPAHAHLDALALPYERREFPEETEKGAAGVARALGFPERRVVKTLVFEAHTGDASSSWWAATRTPSPAT
jgi:prolyl-tRNA editing enzyme YbaK/EbsC (Cys-tRNA(Pro) deacylase)